MDKIQSIMDVLGNETKELLGAKDEEIVELITNIFTEEGLARMSKEFRSAIIFLVAIQSEKNIQLCLHEIMSPVFIHAQNILIKMDGSV